MKEEKGGGRRGREEKEEGVSRKRDKGEKIQ